MGWTSIKPELDVIFFMPNSAEHENFSAINIKMLTIFIFISREKNMFSYV